MAALYIHKTPGVQKFKETLTPDLDLYSHFTYANKVIGGLIRVEAKIAKYVPALKEDALLIAKNAAQFLMEQSRPEGDRLEFFPPTYYGDKVASKKDWNVGSTVIRSRWTTARATWPMLISTCMRRPETNWLLRRPRLSSIISLWFRTLRTDRFLLLSICEIQSATRSGLTG